MSRMDEGTMLQLSLLVEDAGRLQNTIGRCMRSGLGASDVLEGRSNRDLLLQDLDMLKAQVAGTERVLRASERVLPLPRSSGRERIVFDDPMAATETRPKPELQAEEDKQAIGGG